MPCGTASYQIKKPGSGNKIRLGEPTCRAPEGSLPGLMAYSDAIHHTGLYCEYNFIIGFKGDDRELAAPLFYNLRAFAEDDEEMLKPIAWPWIKATRDPAFCGPDEDYGKLSHNVSEDRCRKAFHIVLDGCESSPPCFLLSPPFS